MAWFRRNRDEQADAAGVEETPAAETRTDTGALFRADRPRAGDWMALPPMATTVGPPPTSFRVQRVSEIMTTRRPMALAGQLGHQISHDAPSGRVEGLATAVGPPQPGIPAVSLPLRQAHRAAPFTDSPVRPPGPRIAAGAGPSDSIDAEHDTPSTPQPRSENVGVQRALATVPTPASTPARPATLPEPGPSRVLREPALPLPAALTRPAPAVTVVDARIPDEPRVLDDDAADATPEYYEPATPVEFTVTAGDATPGRVDAPSAPLAGETSMSSAVDAAGTATGSERPSLGATTELPLAAPARPAPQGEIMPPIQPRAIQRRAERAPAAATPQVSPAPAAATPPGPSALPPFPAWARELLGESATATVTPATPATPDAAHASAPPASMTLHTVQREHRDDEGPHDHPAFADEEYDEAVDAVEATIDSPEIGSAAGEDIETAPLLGAMAVQTARSGDGPATATAATPRAAASPDLPLHAAASPGIDRAAPLLGDRPIHVQRVAGPAGAPTTSASTSQARAAALPLAVDAGAGPALQAQPTARTVATQPSAGSPAGSPGASPMTSPVAVQTLHAASVSMSANATPSGPNAGRPLPASVAGAAPVASTATTASTPATTASMPLQAPARPSHAAETQTMIGDFAVAAGLGHRAPDGSLVVSRQVATSGDAPMSLQREASGGTAAAPPTAGATGAAGSSSPVAHAAFVVQRADSPTSAAGGQDAADVEKQTEELAAKVYDRIRWKLAADARANERRLGAGHWNRKGR